ncbi:MAG: leucine--tRNA ligase [Candidatus Doudnabacteria bacterium]|nr:leucine--tRNA ligase [Candidatus Doudnabacteria bacterium]
METYNHKEIEKKWQKYWLDQKINNAADNTTKPKKYVLIEFPYPSGEGLHMGHLRPYLAGDIYSRFMRMNGNNTLYPIGWDAFGLPAENFAIKKGVHPSISTAKNIANAKSQLQSWGMGFDWDREVNTTDPLYYKWTQWIFLQFYKAGLAYEATGLINWCPKDKTGLANEEVVDGKCERCGTVVEKKELRQWYLRITAYAEKLLAGLKDLNWPEQVKSQQENWIGRSEGAEIEFETSYEDKTDFLILHGYTGLPGKNFIPWLKKELEDKGYAVQSPELPNSDDPKEIEQVEYVLKNSHIGPNTIIIGHSLGCVVAQKVLVKHGKPVRGLILVAPAIDPAFPGAEERPFWKNFKWDIDYNKVIELSRFRKVLSDLKEEKRAAYLQFLSDKLNASLVTGESVREHFCATEEPVILAAVLPKIKVFTTRPDTLFGATYMVLAPEHPLVEQLTTKDQEKYVPTYVHKSKEKSDLERSTIAKDKTGVFTGSYAINPATKQKVPIWVADYVLGNYGTGAIMAVPAHDERDYEFAKKYDLGIVKVVNDEGDRRLPNLRDGRLMNSGKYNNTSSSTARSAMAAEFGQAKVMYKLRDWVFSRQRYWGEPIPLIHCGKCGIVAVPENELPVKLPEVEKYEPTGTGESPLAAIDSWVNVKCPNCQGPAKRETNTMPQWAGSSWYWLRYTDSKNDREFASNAQLQKWTPVDVYFGGMEHTTLHLLYARFWNLFLHDQKLVTTKEPFQMRVPHGIILGPDGEKMSKSRGNVVNPDDIVEKHGADTLRMFEPFLGPHDATVPWNDQGIIGVKRFLDKVWRFQQNLKDGDYNHRIHKLIKKVTDDIQSFKFNTAIAAFMEFLNANKEMSRENWEIFLVLLAPFAPHITEELWHLLGHQDSIHQRAWPKFDERLVRDESATVVVQVLGRVRASLSVAVGASQDEVRLLAQADPNVKRHLDGKQIIKEIFVPDKLINFVVK